MRITDAGQFPENWRSKPIPKEKGDPLLPENQHYSQEQTELLRKFLGTLEYDERVEQVRRVFADPTPQQLAHFSPEEQTEFVQENKELRDRILETLRILTGIDTNRFVDRLDRADQAELRLFLIRLFADLDKGQVIDHLSEKAFYTYTSRYVAGIINQATATSHRVH